MGSAMSALSAPSTLPTPPSSSLIKPVDHGVGRVPYPSPESSRGFDVDQSAEDDDIHIKDEPMSEILPSIEEECDEDETYWKAEHVRDGTMRCFQTKEDMRDDSSSYSIEGNDLEDSYDANERYANLDIEENRQQEAQLQAAEQTGEAEFDLEAFLEEQKRRAPKMVQEGWKPDTVEAYMLIERRDYEILFPDSWRCQFPQFPAAIFCDRNRTDNGLLGPLTKNRDTTMKWAITKFLELAPRIRDNSRPSGHTYYKRRPEGLVEDYIKRYAKMVYKDAGLERDVRKKHLPTLFTFASAMYGTPPNVLEAKILYKLRRRAARVVNLLRVTDETPFKSIDAAEKSETLFEHDGEYYLYEPPTLYGIVSSQTVSALVAYEPLAETECIRQMAFFHFSKDVFDVWNCIALALMIIWCRDHMLNMMTVLPDHSDEIETDFDDDDL
jgi:hypothetical protein